MKSFKIITGERGEGKTTYILSHFSGFKGYVTVHKSHEYYLRDLKTKEETLLLTPYPLFVDKWKGWYINTLAFGKANKKLLSLNDSVVVLDEVGMLEVENGGFSDYLFKAADMDIDLVISVRREYIDSVVSKFFSSYKPQIISVGRFP